MDRRQALKKAAALGAVPAAFAYGAPAAAAGGGQVAAATSQTAAAVEEGLRLPLTRMGMPVELHGTIAKLAGFWSDLATGGEVARTFAQSPATALKQAGLSGEIAANDPVIDVMRMSLDPALKAKVANLDYKGFMRALRDRGLVSAGRMSAYRRDVQELLKRDHEAFRQMFNSVVAAAPHLYESMVKDERINALLEILEADKGPAANGALKAGEIGGSNETNAGFVPVTVAIVIAVTIVAYVSVVVGASVVLMVAVSISVGAAMGVTVGGGGGCGSRPEGCPIIQRIGEHERQNRRAAAVAQMMGRPDLAEQTVRAEIDSQMGAIIQTATDLGLLRVPSHRRAQFQHQLRALTYEAAGVGTV